MDGTEVIRQVREWSTIPILMLSAREQEQAKIAALAQDPDVSRWNGKSLSSGQLEDLRLHRS